MQAIGVFHMGHGIAVGARSLDDVQIVRAAEAFAALRLGRTWYSNSPTTVTVTGLTGLS